jgi:hypothetical protein
MVRDSFIDEASSSGFSADHQLFTVFLNPLHLNSRQTLLPHRRLTVIYCNELSVYGFHCNVRFPQYLLSATKSRAPSISVLTPSCSVVADSA